MVIFFGIKDNQNLVQNSFLQELKLIVFIESWGSNMQPKDIFLVSKHTLFINSRIPFPI